jgi:hypothetical protein
MTVWTVIAYLWGAGILLAPLARLLDGDDSPAERRPPPHRGIHGRIMR